VETRHASLETPDLRDTEPDQPCRFDDTESRRSSATEWSSPPGGALPRSAPRAPEAVPAPLTERTLRERLVRIIGQAGFDRYFDGRVRLLPAPGRIEVRAPSRAAADVLRRRFGVAIRQAGSEDAAPDARSPEVVFIAAPDAATTEPAPAPAPAHAPAVARAEPSVTVPRTHGARAAAQPRYRLEDFVVGESNRMAYNAAAHLADGHDAGSSRTLFIHGPCGLGKTHLLHGVAQRFRERLPGATVRFTSGEAFMNDFVAAIRAAGAQGRSGPGGVAKFRSAYRRADLLCIDDVHFLAAKQATQEELLHTFDEIERGGARVLLVSDQHPRALRKFSPALVSRFMSGLVASIAPPEAALRERIVRVFAIRRGLALDDSGIRAVASRAAWLPAATAGPSIRDIEGMLTKIDALRRVAPEYLSPEGRLGAAAVDRAFGAGGNAADHAPGTIAAPSRPTRPVRMHVIIAQTCSALAIDPAELATRTRHKRVVLARAIITYLSRALTTLSFPDIARAIGRPSHSTVITAYQRIQKQMGADEPVLLDHGAEPTTLNTLTRQLMEAVVHASAKG